MKRKGEEERWMEDGRKREGIKEGRKKTGEKGREMVRQRIRGDQKVGSEVSFCTNIFCVASILVHLSCGSLFSGFLKSK